MTQQGVADGLTFEAIRLALIDFMAESRARDVGTGNTATFQLAREKPFRYMSNVTDALRELMRLGFVERSGVPSDPKSTPHYMKATYAPTKDGQAWARLIATDRAAAYDELIRRLWRLHPQFAGYMRAIATQPLTVPLAAFTDVPEPRTREAYVDLLAERAARAIADGRAGWTASRDEIHKAVRDYINARVASARSRQRPDPYPRNQDFINACEEALVKLAFARAGESIDYITHEVLRRWMRVLALANFSYYVPGVDALRIWPTASVREVGSELDIERRIGEEYRDRVVEVLGEAYEEVKRQDHTSSSWISIYRLRAAVCWKLRVSDSVFNRALEEFLRGQRGANAPFAANIDQAQFGPVPPSERGLQVETKRGLQTYYSISLIPRRERNVV